MGPMGPVGPVGPLWRNDAPSGPPSRDRGELVGSTTVASITTTTASITTTTTRSITSTSIPLVVVVVITVLRRVTGEHYSRYRITVIPTSSPSDIITPFHRI